MFTLQAMYKSYGSCRELMELRNLTSVGELILMSALQRRRSCGGHFCIDDPAGAVRLQMPYPHSHRLLGGAVYVQPSGSLSIVQHHISAVSSDLILSKALKCSCMGRAVFSAFPRYERQQEPNGVLALTD